MRFAIALLAFLLAAGCNGAPNAHAGFDQFAMVGRTVMLDGSRSRDRDSDHLTYRWTVDSPDVVLSSSTGKRVEVTASQPGEYEIILRVSDGAATSTDRTTLRADFEAHVLVGSRTPGAPLLEFDSDFQLVQEFVSYSLSQPQLWPLSVRRTPDGTLLIIEEADTLGDGCSRTVERYSSGGEHIETVRPRGDCESIGTYLIPYAVFETDGSIFVADNGRLKVIREGQPVEDLLFGVPGAQDIVQWRGTLYATMNVDPAIGVAQVSPEGLFVGFVLDSSLAGYPGRMDVAPTDEIALANFPTGLVFRPDAGVISAFESTPTSGESTTGVGIAPDRSIWAVSSQSTQSIAHTTTSGTTLFTHSLLIQPVAIALIY